MMKFLIFVTFLVGVLYAAKSKKSKDGTKQLLQAIKNELSELKKGQGVLGEKIQSLDEGQEVLGEKIQSLDDGQGVLGEKIQSLDDGQGVLGEKIQSLEKKLEKAGTWRLGMNINPADGHIFGYTVGWATGIDIGSDDEALTKDYLSAKVWVTPANCIAIVRHQRGVVDAVKVFKFKVPGESLSTRFGLKNMNPGRQIVTQGGPIQESVADDADNLGDDPIFSVGGDLAFNWTYSNNGCRIALTEGHLSGADVNDDNTHGLGNDFGINPLTDTINSVWAHDISNIQDCPMPACKT
ncbi:uncharacterized protein LOC134822717 [Bolinopsis microptera]|uniref:uncharacterized protein LOC134822717 n=1 Tax=Bolinopsis microptera TaxID=2820187 RepID=UPI003079A647